MRYLKNLKAHPLHGYGCGSGGGGDDDDNYSGEKLIHFVDLIIKSLKSLHEVIVVFKCFNNILQLYTRWRHHSAPEASGPARQATHFYGERRIDKTLAPRRGDAM